MSGSLAWLAVQTWPRHEKKVAAELEKKQIGVFLPLVDLSLVVSIQIIQRSFAIRAAGYRVEAA